MRPLILIVFICFAYVSSFAQQRQIDSLENLLKQKLDDTTRALSMMRLAINYEGIDTARAAKIYREAIEFGKARSLFYELGRIYHNQGILFNASGKYESAKKSFDTALSNLRKSNNPNVESRTAGIYNDIGNSLGHLNDFKGAIEYRLKAVEVFEKLKNANQVITSYLNISSMYKEQNEFGKQEEYARKALSKARISQTPDAFFKSYTFIAFADNMQNKYIESELYVDSARAYYSNNFPQEVLISFHLIAGLTYMNVNKLDKARKEFQDGYDVAERFKARYSMTQTKMQLSRVMVLQKDFKRGEPLLLEAYREAKDQQDATQLNIALDYLARLYEEKGDFKQALFYHKEYKIISDSISSQQNKEFATSLELQLETKQKVVQINELEAEKKIQALTISKKNTLNYILIGSAGVLFLVSLLLYRNYSQKQKLQQQRINELETEKKLAATEAVLKGEEQERTRLAKDLHDGLGGMLSGIKFSLNTMKGNLIMTPENAQAFERSMDMLDSSIKEMRRVAHNMMPEALVKFGLDTALKDFCSHINQTGALKISYQSLGMEKTEVNQTTAITIYRVVQELVNNIIKHAQATNAIVQLTKDGDQLAVTVEDNGKGFNTDILHQSKGIGWDNIKNRVDFLKGKLDVQSSANKGTSVHIEIDAG